MLLEVEVNALKKSSLEGITNIPPTPDHMVGSISMMSVDEEHKKLKALLVSKEGDVESM